MNDMRFCHQRPERSFHIWGKQLPLCARCTGIVLGQLAAMIWMLCAGQPVVGWLGLALIVPTVLDGWLQMKFDFESNNARRCVTGVMAGIGCIIWTSWKVNFVLEYLI